MGLHASLNNQGRAWLHSLSFEGSVRSAFLRALPMHPLFTLVPALYAIALRHQLFAPQPLITAGASCGSCGLALDTTGTHYIVCMGMASRTRSGSSISIPLSSGWCVLRFGRSFPTPASSARTRMRPPSIPPTTSPTLPCWTMIGRVATCSLMSPWLGRFPVATSSGRLLMPALLPLWPSTASLPPTAMWGPMGSSPKFRSSRPWAPRRLSFFMSAVSGGKTASTSRVSPVVCPDMILVLAAAPVPRPHSHGG
eukprot:jgi/Mesvir1/18692/Mv25672-RA.1